jgi:hypothetical protein
MRRRLRRVPGGNGSHRDLLRDQPRVRGCGPGVLSMRRAGGRALEVSLGQVLRRCAHDGTTRRIVRLRGRLRGGHLCLPRRPASRNPGRMQGRTLRASRRHVLQLRGAVVLFDDCTRCERRGLSAARYFRATPRSPPPRASTSPIRCDGSLRPIRWEGSARDRPLRGLSCSEGSGRGDSRTRCMRSPHRLYREVAERSVGEQLDRAHSILVGAERVVPR